MNDVQQSVLERLERFQLDAPGASFPFSRKLAQENHWTALYAARVIEEYKRFAFLAVASGHPVSPSEDVDQVWHMHLTYSQNYWKVFCPEILGMPFHHNPTQGGLAEHAKFDDWYRKTLESYRTFFQSEPPSDIWPSPEERQRSTAQFARVDKSTHWVIPKIAVTQPIRNIAVGVLALIVLGCSSAVATSNPFDWDGPTFLQFYWLLFPTCFISALVARHFLKVPLEAAHGQPTHVDGYEIACLNGGRVLAIDAVIAALIHQGIFAVVPRTLLVVRTALPYAGNNPLESFVAAIPMPPTGVGVNKLRVAALGEFTILDASLRSKGLFMEKKDQYRAMLIPFAICAFGILIGLVKIGVGIERDRPVGFLVMLCIISATLSVGTFLQSPRRSRYGDMYLARLREQYSHFRRIGHHQTNISPQEMEIAIGLYGAGALAGSMYSDIVPILHTPNSSSGASGGCGGTTSGCGGGGGGCGGGGCGGCGG